MVDKNKQEPEEVKANLPLPEDPPGSSDMKSADVRYHIGTGSGRFSGNVAGDPTRQPVTQESSVRVDENVMHKETAP
jgi:hypothetical protein